jgi:hypothetical protein
MTALPNQERPQDDSPADVPVVESSTDELASLRHLLDLSLQPLDQFGGFNKIEQFGGSALRYQLNFISYALSLAQYTRTPAFTGYLAEAQANSIAKMCGRRVWSYWAAENLVGYQRWNPDPMIKANVMYTGFFGAMIGMYETLNQDSRFDEPGSLTLHLNRSTKYRYDFKRIADVIENNMRDVDDEPQYPCEPRLIYPMCNAYAINSLRMHDRLHGTAFTGDLVDKLRVSYSENGWLTDDDRFVACKSRGGRKIVGPVLFHDGVMVAWINAVMPDIARRTWSAMRAQFFDVADGTIEFKGPPRIESLDFGNYKIVKGDSFTRTSAMVAAREMGDDAVADALDESVEERYKTVWRNGARRHDGLSNWSNAMYTMSLLNREDGLRDLINGVVPSHWRTGPVLAEAGYPDVLVARAVTDGTALDLVLQPGDGPKRTNLGIARLVAGREYRVAGATSDTVTADSSGRALVEIDIDGRLEVRLTPVG